MLVREVQETSQRAQALIIAIGCLPDVQIVDDITNFRHRTYRIELDLASKLPHRGLAFIELEDSMYVTKVE